MLKQRSPVSLGACLVALLVVATGACGRSPTSVSSSQTRTQPNYSERIELLKRQSVLTLSYKGAVLVDSGASTSCEDPEFDNRTPAVFSEYTSGEPSNEVAAWLAQKITSEGWIVTGSEPTAGGSVLITNFMKPFETWRAVLLLSVRVTGYQIVLQASERSNCSE